MTSRGSEGRTGVRRHIRRGQRDGSVRSDVDAQTLAGEIISFLQGAGLQWFLDPHHFDIVGISDHYFDRLVRRISTPPGPPKAAQKTRRRS